MWYKVRARDNRIFKPDGKVLTFSIWADSDEKFWELTKEKEHTENLTTREQSDKEEKER